MKILTQIEECIDWYGKNYEKATPDQLLNCKTKINTLSFNYLNEVGEAKKGSVMNTVYRKYHHHKFKSQLIEQKMTAALAESKSIHHVFEDMKAEAESEALAYLTKLKLDHANRIADDIMQRLSFLRDEIKII